MTEKPFDALEPGDFVADMHDGLGPIRKRFGVVSHVQWRVQDMASVDGGKGIPFVSFPNKQLRVLGAQDDGSLVCGYNYDGMFAGVVIISQYVTGPDPRD